MAPPARFLASPNTARLRFKDGVPDITGLPSDTITNRAGEPYMHRYFLEGAPTVTPSIRLHHILLSDEDLYLHDHPWDFVTLLLAGRYVETTDTGDTEHTAPTALYRRAEDPHRLTLPDGPVWTYVTTGQARRTWGFWTDEGWIGWRQNASQDANSSNADR